MMCGTSQNKDNPYSIRIDDWQDAGLAKQSWARIDRIVSISEWYMDRKIGELSERDLTKIMQLVAEILSNKQHDFSLLAIKNNDEQFLQIYDERWNSWLFPYVRSSENNKENVDLFASELFREEIETEYVTVAKHCKYSVCDDEYKIYNHKLYKALIKDIPRHLSDDADKFRWMTIEELESDDGCFHKKYTECAR